MKETISLILLAGGQGLRFGSSLPKQYHLLGDTPLACHSFKTLMNLEGIEEIIVVCEEGYQAHFPGARFALPGKRRQDSTANGLKLCQGKWVMIHDSARPFLKIADLERLKVEALRVGAATLATPVKVTIKESDLSGAIIKTLDRSRLWDIQTPQMIRRDWLEEGFRSLADTGETVTDDISVIERLGYPAQIVEGQADNIKITSPIDLVIAQGLLCHATG